MSEVEGISWQPAYRVSKTGSLSISSLIPRGRSSTTILAVISSDSLEALAQLRRAMRTILLVVIILLLLGALPTWPYSAGWGYYPSGGLGLVLVIVVILALMGRL
jgi:hypothetical protein